MEEGWLSTHLGVRRLSVASRNGRLGCLCLWHLCRHQQDRTFRDEVAWAWLRVKNCCA
jgi:hypothetical protein